VGAARRGADFPRTGAFSRTANSARSASSADEWWPSRQTSIVLRSATSLAIRWIATCLLAGTVVITDSGTSATPAPAATHATIAWYDVNSRTRPGMTFD